MAELIQDEGIILKVNNWQTADKYVICFTRGHGKLRFIAYGARYARSVAGRLLQPFARLQLELTLGQKVERLKNAELVVPPQGLDFKQMAYAAVATELTAVLTEDHQPQEEVYELLDAALQLMGERNPRLVVLAYAIQLLAHTGFQPQVMACVACGTVQPVDAECFFDPLQGGLICPTCHRGMGEESFSSGARQLWATLAQLDLRQPQPFTVRGGDLMDLERILYKFILCQTDKPLHSINFLSQLGL